MRDGSWSALYRLAEVPDPVCQSSVIQWLGRLRGHGRERVAYVGPNSSSPRVHLALRISTDGGATWPVSRLLYAGPAAYSSACVMPDNSLGIFFERDNYTKITFMRVEDDWIFDLSLDGDLDGLPDAWEVFSGVANPEADDDRDGANNGAEFLAGTNPLDAESYFHALSFEAGNTSATMRWRTFTGRVYGIETRGNFIDWLETDAVIA